MTAAALTGFLTGFSLILAIGAQNAFVLQQGLRRQHVFALALLCALSDAVLITAGVAGFGWLVGLNPRFPLIMALAGAAFLVVYGAMRLRAAWRGGEALAGADGGGGLRRVVLTGLALTWLNPHVYLDTMGLIGAVSTRFAGAGRLAFGMGAVAASFVFFFGLGYGARLLAPMMARPGAWRLFDALVGLTMWAIAGGLVAGFVF